MRPWSRIGGSALGSAGLLAARSCRPPARRAAAARARWPARGRSPAGAGRRRAGCGPARRPCRRRPTNSSSSAAPLAALAAPRVGTVGRADQRRPDALAGRAVPADQHVLSAVMSANSRMFWKVRAMPGLGDPVGPAARTIAGRSNRISPRVGRVQAGEHVEEGGLAGAVGPDQADDLARLDARSTSLTASRPPKRLVTSRGTRGSAVTASMPCSAAWVARAAPAGRVDAARGRSSRHALGRQRPLVGGSQLRGGWRWPRQQPSGRNRMIR